MTVWTTLLDVVVLLLAAMVLGIVAERLKQSAIVGFMLAGVLLGPNSPLQGWAASMGEGWQVGPTNADLVGDMAQLGVTLLMFTIGLEFNWSRLKTLGAKTLLAGGLQIVLTTAAAAAVGLAFGMGTKAAVALGLALPCHRLRWCCRCYSASARWIRCTGDLRWGFCWYRTRQWCLRC